MDGDREEPQVGSVAQEAAKLLGALTGWAKDAAHETGHAVDEHLDTGAAECTVCPICRTVHAVRGLSPEVKTQLTSAATSLMQAAAALMATAVPEEGGRDGVEHIDLDDAADWDGDWPDEDTDITDDEERDR